MSDACGICGSERGATWLESKGWRYRKCDDCSAVWLDPMPADGWAESFYDESYFVGGGRGGYRDFLADEVQHRDNARARVALARRCGAGSQGAWLDVGCATGFMLDEARKAGYTVLGVEVSAWARGIALERFGLNVMPTLGEVRREFPGLFDVVSFFQSLEHLRDPLAALHDARACLRPDGLLVIETWDRGSFIARLFGRYWQQITPPSVLWLFDRKSITRALERAGFRPTAFLRTSKSVSLGWVVGILAEKAPRVFGPAVWVLDRFPRLQRLGIRYGLGDLITVVAVAADREAEPPHAS